MDKLLKKYGSLNFSQECYNTAEFLAFAKLFKAELIKQIKALGGSLHKFSIGHFYLYGFIVKQGHLYYFSWHNGDQNLLYRIAQHDKDFTGGTNQWVKIDSNLSTQMRLK